MTVLRTTIFGGIKYKPNTFIGGVSAISHTKALLESAMNLTSSNVKSFKIRGVDVETHLQGYFPLNNFFKNRSDITYFKTNANILSGIGNGFLENATNLIELEFNGTLGQIQGGGPIIQNTKLVTLTISNAAIFTANGFLKTNSLFKTLVAPLTNFNQGDKGIESCPLLEYVDARSTKRFGRKQGVGVLTRGSFFSGSGVTGGHIKCHENCLTVDSDGPDHGSIDYNLAKLIAKSWTVEFYNSAGVITSTIP